MTARRESLITETNIDQNEQGTHMLLYYTCSLVYACMHFESIKRKSTASKLIQPISCLPAPAATPTASHAVQSRGECVLRTVDKPSAGQLHSGGD